MDSIMTFLQLRHFTVLAQLASFAKASKALFITQPALSRSIKALEEELGQLLFDRVGKRIELTSFGVTSLKRAQALLDGLNDLKKSGQAFNPTTQGLYRLGLSSGPGALLASPLLAHIAQHFPNVKIEIYRANTQTLVSLLKERRVDGLVIDLRAMQPDSDLWVQETFEFRGEFMCRKGHPLLKLKSVPFAKLLEYPMASTPLSDELARLLVSQYGERAHPNEMIRLASDEIHNLIEVAQVTDTVVLAAKAAGSRLSVLNVEPALRASARYATVSVKNRSNAVLHEPIIQVIHDIFHQFKLTVG
jgi:DNA-binding transcriptional LysR family regulator